MRMYVCVYALAHLFETTKCLNKQFPSYSKAIDVCISMYMLSDIWSVIIWPIATQRSSEENEEAHTRIIITTHTNVHNHNGTHTHRTATHNIKVLCTQTIQYSLNT